MDDRSTTGLHLELCELGADEYRHRAGAICGRPGVSRISWWECCRPGRDDIPMRIRTGTLLGIAEVDDRFTAPPAPEGVTSHHFVRHPRPSQGILTGRPTTGLLVVWISPREPDTAQGLRDWGDFVHLRHIAAAAVPGFTQISVYENADAADPLYLHFYEMDTKDPEEAFLAMPGLVAARLGGMGSDDYSEWADLRGAGGRLFYCNTFRLLGEVPATT
jgi:hypothetical protein